MSKSRRPTLAEQAYQELGGRIVSGHLIAGQRPFAQELAGQLEISPTPVKEALSRLEREGLVEAALAALRFHLERQPQGIPVASARGDADARVTCLCLTGSTREGLMLKSLKLTAAVGAVLAASAALSGAQAQTAPKVAVDLTTLTSPFWTAYNKYIEDEAKAQGIDLLQPFNSEFDTAKQITGVQERHHARRQGLIFSPFDTSAAEDRARTPPRRPTSRSWRWTSRPTTGPVAIVVRANNVAYGEKACQYIGEHVKEGPVVQIMGDQASINGRDRGNGFRDCITKNFPKLKLLEIPTKAWSGEDAAAGLETVLNSTPDLKAIYMHAGGVFLAPTLQTLKRKRPAASGRRGRAHRHRLQRRHPAGIRRASATARSTPRSRSRPTSTPSTA